MLLLIFIYLVAHTLIIDISSWSRCRYAHLKHSGSSTSELHHFISHPVLEYRAREHRRKWFTVQMHRDSYFIISLSFSQQSFLLKTRLLWLQHLVPFFSVCCLYSFPIFLYRCNDQNWINALTCCFWFKETFKATLCNFLRFKQQLH